MAKINGIKDLSEWLQPSDKYVHDPYLLDNIRTGCKRISKALDKGEKISVFCDIDADGVTSGVMIYQYLSNYTTNLEILYCQRSQGHGIENYIKNNKIETDLLVIVDSSTNSVDACKEIKESGIDIIVIDHHLMTHKNPHVILINNQTCKYPNKELSGSGVTFKVLQVLDDELNEHMAFDYIDLAGLGVYGDVMSMAVPENRYFVYQSLKNINNLGLTYLLKQSGAFLNLNSTTYGFNVVPIINASARMEQIELVIKLLISDDPEECKDLAKKCIKLNEERKNLQREVYGKIKNKIIDDGNMIVVVTDESSQGFNGLIATQISDNFKKPCLVVKNENGFCKGSARTYGNFKLKSFLEKSKLFEFTTGHEGSFGVGFFINNLEKIKDYAKDIEIEDKEDDIIYDLAITLEDVTDEFVDKVAYFNYITGKNVSESKFLIKDVFVWERTLMGKKVKEHVKLISDNKFPIVKFRVPETYAEEAEFNTIDVIGSLNINKWYHFGKKEVIRNNQMLMDCFKISQQ